MDFFKLLIVLKYLLRGLRPFFETDGLFLCCDILFIQVKSFLYLITSKINLYSIFRKKIIIIIIVYKVFNEIKIVISNFFHYPFVIIYNAYYIDIIFYKFLLKLLSGNRNQKFWYFQLPPAGKNFKILPPSGVIISNFHPPGG